MHMSTFTLDAYEVTVSRLRAFVLSGNGVQANAPQQGAGAGPGLPNGWDPAWNSGLSPTTADFENALSCDGTYQTWTLGPAANDLKPANCISWYEAVAFCAWDQGYMPSNFQWNYSAAGGSEQRQYPWSSPSYSTYIDSSYASYQDSSGNCLADGSPACTLLDIINVGAKPAGAGKWGHADLGGNVAEWVSDGGLWGGGFNYPASALITGQIYFFPSTARAASVGFRCAR